MKERPIIFNGDMVRAILDGRKSQTRRVVKPQPTVDAHGAICFPWATFYTNGHIHTWDDDGEGGENWNSLDYPHENKYQRALSASESSHKCPYGKPGDRLWVRETWALRTGSQNDHHSRVFFKDGTSQLEYWQTGNHVPERYGYLLSETSRWRSPIHIPRWASRITLQIAEVRVERVQEISEEDAKAEGIDIHAATSENTGLSYDYIRYRDYGSKCSGSLCCYLQDAATSFRTLWDSINKKRGYGWEENPWIWTISFKRVG